jgi:hypothetical protein
MTSCTVQAQKSIWYRPRININTGPLSNRSAGIAHRKRSQGGKAILEKERT